MKKWLLFWILLGPALSAGALDFELGFSPGGTALHDVLKVISTAQKSVIVAAYEFTSARVAGALVRAEARGATVSVIMDERASKTSHSQASYLARHGVTVRVDGQYAIFHHNRNQMPPDTSPISIHIMDFPQIRRHLC